MTETPWRIIYSREGSFALQGERDELNYELIGKPNTWATDEAYASKEEAEKVIRLREGPYSEDYIYSDGGGNELTKEAAAELCWGWDVSPADEGRFYRPLREMEEEAKKKGAARFHTAVRGAIEVRPRSFMP